MYVPKRPTSYPLTHYILDAHHTFMKQAPTRMREMTSGCTLPEDACQAFRALYDGLEEPEADLHEHIHLENNLLFPGGIELECSLG